MLKKETITKIAGFLKVKADDLETAIKDTNEVDFAVDEKLTVLTEDEAATLRNNEYKKGKDAGIETAVKDAKDKHGFDFSGKTLDGLIDHVKASTLKEAGKEPSEKIKEYETKINTLQATAKEYETKLSQKESEFEGYKQNSELAKFIPAGSTLDADDIITLMRSKGYEFKTENNKLVAYKDGNKLTDKLSADLAAKDVVESFVKEKKLVADTPPQPGGRGGGDGKTSALFTKASEVRADFKAQGKSDMGEEFSAKIQELVKANPDFVID